MINDIMDLSGSMSGQAHFGIQGPQGPQGDRGSDGKSAYQYAIEGGYTGTEEEFAEKMASWIIRSSTEGSTKKFKITVDDNGTLTAQEVI